MIVTDKQYYIEERLVNKLELMINRMTGKNKDDNVILIDGDEGQGKTNIEMAMCYYVHHRTGREFSLNNVFFDLDKLIMFAKSTQDQIIAWDEGALGGLAAEWWKKNQIKFIKLLMICRKKRHFICICVPKFFKLNEYLVVDRSIALIHVFSKKNIQKGRFYYYTKRKKEKLYDEWRSSRKREYRKMRSFRGTFGIVEDIVFPAYEYDKMKDEAILNFDKDDKKPNKNELKIMDIKIKLAKHPNIDKEALAEVFGTSLKSVQRWKNMTIKDLIDKKDDETTDK